MIAPTLTTEGFTSATDEALMGAITNRNENALAALYQRHGETLRSIIESVIHEQAEAEDVLQETLLQIWKQAQNYAPKVGQPLGWLTTITRRRAIDRLRRRQAYIRVKDRYEEQINELPGGLARRETVRRKWNGPICAVNCAKQCPPWPNFHARRLDYPFLR